MNPQQWQQRKCTLWAPVIITTHQHNNRQQCSTPSEHRGRTVRRGREGRGAWLSCACVVLPLPQAQLQATTCPWSRRGSRATKTCPPLGLATATQLPLATTPSRWLKVMPVAVAYLSAPTASNIIAKPGEIPTTVSPNPWYVTLTFFHTGPWAALGGTGRSTDLPPSWCLAWSELSGAHRSISLTSQLAGIDRSKLARSKALRFTFTSVARVVTL